MKIVNSIQALSEMERIKGAYIENEYDGEDLVIELLEMQPHLERMERSFCCTTEEYREAIRIFNKLKDTAYRHQEILGEDYLGSDDLRSFGLSQVPDESPFNIVSVQRKKV